MTPETPLTRMMRSASPRPAAPLAGLLLLAVLLAGCAGPTAHPPEADEREPVAPAVAPNAPAAEAPEAAAPDRVARREGTYHFDGTWVCPDSQTGCINVMSGFTAGEGRLLLPQGAMNGTLEATWTPAVPFTKRLILSLYEEVEEFQGTLVASVTGESPLLLNLTEPLPRGIYQMRFDAAETATTPGEAVAWSFTFMPVPPEPLPSVAPYDASFSGSGKVTSTTLCIPGQGCFAPRSPLGNFTLNGEASNVSLEVAWASSNPLTDCLRIHLDPDALTEAGGVDASGTSPLGIFLDEPLPHGGYSVAASGCNGESAFIDHEVSWTFRFTTTTPDEGE